MKQILMFTVCCCVMAGLSVSYQQSIRSWQQHRDVGLRSPDGWLTLIGLDWLKPGDNAVDGFGTVRLKGKQVIFVASAKKPVTVNNRPVTRPVPLSFDDENPDVVRSGSLSFYVIERVGKLGVRIRDSNSANLKKFPGMSYFPVNTALHFANARLVPDPKKIPILNVLGQTELEESPGVVEFSYQGHRYGLRPIYEDKTLFFLFKDLTNKTETYQAGRMLNVPLPVAGRVDLDFNRAYNPPCTFTPYATCPLPPKQNELPFAVNAGEKRYAHAYSK